MITFHNNIRLDMTDLKAVIEKRDMLINEVIAFFKRMGEEKKIKEIKVEPFNQGSYAMGTGNKAYHNEHDYDIDCGLLIEVNIKDYTPLQVKQWIFDALDSNQFRKVKWKKACIRVQYTEEGFPKFHVDFACYAKANDDGKTYLAKGTPTSAPENRKWEIAEPKTLRDLINNKFTNDEECSQFKRIIRDTKRWKDKQFSSVNGKPTGIALTALAYHGFVPYTKDRFSSATDVNDLKALVNFVDSILGQFNPWNGRISVSLPVPPGNDLFAKVTDQQCEEFKKKLESLRNALAEAEQEPDPHEACKILQRQFGDDFPVPTKEATAEVRKKAVAGTSESA